MYYHIFSITSAYINGAQFTVEYIRPFRFISCNSSFLSMSALQRHNKIRKPRKIHQPFVDHITIIIICPIKIIFSMTLFMFYQTILSPVFIVFFNCAHAQKTQFCSLCTKYKSCYCISIFIRWQSSVFRFPSKYEYMNATGNDFEIAT